jgi:hypothetical protein
MRQYFVSNEMSVPSIGSENLAMFKSHMKQWYIWTYTNANEIIQAGSLRRIYYQILFKPVYFLQSSKFWWRHGRILMSQNVYQIKLSTMHRHITFNSVVCIVTKGAGLDRWVDLLDIH